MNKSIVAILPCNNYDEELVYQNVKKGIELIGGLSSIISKDEKILIKPNLLKPLDPSKVATTHPTVFGAVLRCLKEEGYTNITYGDSSAIGANASNEEIAKITGLKEQADKYEVSLGDFDDCKLVKNPYGKTGKKFYLCNEVINADAIISVSKMKTHALENITGAIKNQYGCIYSTNKAIGHAKYPNSRVFAKMLVDLNKLVNPRLHIMDGVIAMDGNGPGAGDPFAMKVILISKDPVALDATYAMLVNLNPEYVPTCVYGEKMGLGNMNFKNISLVTLDGEISKEEAYAKYGNSDFNVNRKNLNFWDLKTMFSKKKERKHKPVVDPNKCVACGVCQEACPVDGKAVHSGNGKKAEYDYTKCIRCYCCQEVCPAKAIQRVDFE